MRSAFELLESPIVTEALQSVPELSWKQSFVFDCFKVKPFGLPTIVAGYVVPALTLNVALDVPELADPVVKV
jgi:hypothetical protein